MRSIARPCQATGADAGAVRRGVGSDTRIGESFLFLWGAAPMPF
jgi:UDP-glucose 6-dehydrogenase